MFKCFIDFTQHITMNQKDKSIQKNFFKTIRQRLPGNISLVHEIAEVLGISYDSAYRRLRGDKDLTIEELKLLSSKYQISIDSLFEMDKADIHFLPFVLGPNGEGFENWLRFRIVEIQKLNTASSKELVLVARDIPVYFYFDFPELAAFKIYFWKKLLLHLPDYHDKKFNINEEPTKLLEIGHHLLSAYNLIPSSEIWCHETFTRIMKQIVFCAFSGFFMNKNDAIILFDKLELLIRHMENQTEQGCKFHVTYQPTENEEENFKVFFNEILLIDNTAFVKRDDKKFVYMTHNSLNILITHDPAFCSQAEHSLRIIMKTGNQISSTSAVERNRFFNVVYEKLEEFKAESFSKMIVI